MCLGSVSRRVWGVYAGAVSYTHLDVYKRQHKAFLDGHETVDNKPCSEQPSMTQTYADVSRLRDLIELDHHLMLTVICFEVNLNQQTVHEILVHS